MTPFRLVGRGLIYHRRMHAGLLIGVVLACGILTGALLVGDSVAYSLREIATARLGRIAYAMDWGSRFFAQDLAKRLQENDSRIRTEAVLSLRGMASLSPGNDSTGNQLNRIQVIGVDAGFWRFAEDTSLSFALGSQEAAVNEKTASALGIRPGDDLLLRVASYGTMPLDAPLSSREHELTVSSLVTVKAVLSDAQLGRFGLAANQATPYNVFVDRAWLQEQTQQTSLANLMLAGDETTLNDLGAALDRSWDLDHVGLRLRTLSPSTVQLESTRIFIDEEVVRAAMDIPGAQSTLTYLVNSISKGERMTPYSFVEAGPVPPGVRDDEVVISQWLADQLQAVPGDALDMAYFQLLPTNAFVERQRTFKVHSVIPMGALIVERDLAPMFPGLSDVENCRDWSIGMPMDQKRLSDPANEAYWRQYGQTPKLLATLKAGQDMWASRFGAVTALRFSGYGEPQLRKLLRDKISADKLGLRFVPVRQIALDAVAQATDFGGLFVGMSMFLIAAALILLGLLYVFGLQQRASEIGVLLALGFSRWKVRSLFLLEACPTAFLGAVLGAGAGIAYARVLLAGLTRFWPAAVAGADIRFHVEPASILLGTSAAVVCAFLIVLGTLWRGMRHSARELITTDFSSDAAFPTSGKRLWVLLIPSISLALAAAIAVNVWLTNPISFIEPFFTVGTLLLFAGLGYYAWLLTYLSRRPSFRRPRLWKVAITNLARRRGRSLSVAGLTACGCFLVFSVSSMQENLALHSDERSSGTGGFALVADTTVPIVAAAADLPETLGIDAVPLRVRDGDDAGCLNLNRATTPRLFGVNAQTLATLGAFVPAQSGDGLWDLLDRPLPDGLIPAIVGDANTALWGLKKKTGLTNGDVLPYRDESGREFKLKLVGQLPMRLSVFQGSILISDADFTRLFPSEAGFRAFLIDAPPGKAPEIAAVLNRTFERFGMQAVPALQRLQEFYAVEATYLAMFLLLGGLGLILGAGGVGIVVLRNVLERRAEMGLLHALGYTRSTMFQILFAENSSLVLAGMLIGILAATTAILPLVLSSQTTVSPGPQLTLLALIITTNVISVGLMLFVGLRKDPTTALREE